MVLISTYTFLVSKTLTKIERQRFALRAVILGGISIKCTYGEGDGLRGGEKFFLALPPPL